MNFAFVFRVTVGQISLVLQGFTSISHQCISPMAQNPTDRRTFPSSQQQSRFCRLSYSSSWRRYRWSGSL